MAKNKGILLVVAAVALGAAIIGWLMFGGEAPANPKTNSNAVVNATIKNTTVSRTENGKTLWEFSVEELESIKSADEAVLKGVKGKLYREDGSVLDIVAGGGRVKQKAKNFALERGVTAVLSSGGKLVADKVTWEQKTDIITAEGKVVLIKGNEQATADKAITTGALQNVKLQGNAQVERGADIHE